MRRTIPILLLIALAGCGGRQALQPAEGQSLPAKPKLAQAVPTPEQLLTVPADAKPGRSDELLTKSEERRDDRFDLPPPG